MTDQKRTIRLTDGTVLPVGDRQYAVIAKLLKVADMVARGGIQNISLVAFDLAGDEAIKTLVALDIEPEALDKLSKALSDHSKRAAQTAALWQGSSRYDDPLSEH